MNFRPSKRRPFAVVYYPGYGFGDLVAGSFANREDADVLAESVCGRVVPAIDCWGMWMEGTETPPMSVAELMNK